MAERDQEFLTALGLTVRRLREQRGVSQEAFALEAGVHRTYIGAIERGERNIGILTLVVLADGLGVDASELVRQAESIRAELGGSR